MLDECLRCGVVPFFFAPVSGARSYSDDERITFVREMLERGAEIDCIVWLSEPYRGRGSSSKTTRILAGGEGAGARAGREASVGMFSMAERAVCV